MTTVEFLQALHNPICYPHAVQEITHIETPNTWVVMTGQFAYKIRKSLTFEPRNLSTIEAHRRHLLEERQLNKIFAPRHTQQIVSVTGTPQIPKIGGDTSIFEYALQMPQFPSTAKLSTMLQAGTLQPFHIDILAQQLAQFHANLPIADKLALSIYQQVMQDNFTLFLENLPTEIGNSHLRQLTDSLLTLFKQQEKTLRAREQQSFIRHCHGNLHLDHLALVDGSMIICGGIVADPTLRWMDVINELSGLLVDLESQQTLAARLLNVYLEYAGNYTGLRLLRFYQAYQTFIRAKIVICRLLKENKGNYEKETLYQHYQTYSTALERYMQPQISPVLIITYGVSGSGKSTVTQLLLEALGAIRLRSDVERKRFFGMDFLERSGATRGLYDPEVSQLVFKGLETLARHILQAGFSVIIDATFLHRASRAPFRRLAYTLGIPYVILACHATEECLFQRIKLRQQKNNDPSDADISILKQQLTIKEPLGIDEQVITVDTNQPLAISKIVAQLRSITSFNSINKG
jgi:hypothetical protein